MVVETTIRIEKNIDTSYLVQLAQCMPIIICHIVVLIIFPDLTWYTEQKICGKQAPAQGNSFKGIDKKLLEQREFQIVHLCPGFSNTLFRRKQNGPKLQSFLYLIISKYYLLNGNHI